ncbi:MAG TPA: OmpA family protein [Steroidobacteraceae bacterium]|nr:OmpA family protein [Steroidobacteraceae bacterium]
MVEIGRASRARLGAALMLSLALAVPGLSGAEELPAWFPRAQSFSVNPDNTVHEDYGRAMIDLGSAGSVQQSELKGHHWHADLYPPPGDESWSGGRVWAEVRTALEKQGFKLVHLESGDVIHATLRKDGAGSTTYAEFVLTRDDGYGNSVEILETATQTLTVTLAPPARAPETFREQDNFPYLTPLPGARRADSAPEPIDEPLDVTTPADNEPHLVGSRYSTKRYEGPSGLSNLAFVSTYGPALRAAGWKILQQSEGLGMGNGIIVAHYEQNGRDLWLKLVSGSAEWAASVADVGQGLRQIATSCRVPVYGLNFDFNRATLRADAEPVLGQVLALFNSMPALSAEIGGHTDNVGKPDYNLQLSADRADAVKSWLVAHGVSASRLSTHGYGAALPVVANDSDAHRARNRRVELKKAGCG